MKRILTALCLLPLAACVTTNTHPPDVVKIGGTTYSSFEKTNSESDLFNAKRLAYTRANEQCKKTEKDFRVINMTETPAHGVEIIFECLDEDNPELQKPPIW